MLGIPVLSVQHLLVYAMELKLFFQGKDDCLTMVQELIILEWTYHPVPKMWSSYLLGKVAI